MVYDVEMFPVFLFAGSIPYLLLYVAHCIKYHLVFLGDCPVVCRCSLRGPSKRTHHAIVTRLYRRQLELAQHCRMTTDRQPGTLYFHPDIPATNRYLALDHAIEITHPAVYPLPAGVRNSFQRPGDQALATGPDAESLEQGAHRPPLGTRMGQG